MDTLAKRSAMTGKINGGRRFPAARVLLALAAAGILAGSGCEERTDAPAGAVAKGGGVPGVRHYRLVVLPPLDGDDRCVARAINGASPVEIVGISKGNDGGHRAIKWRYDEGTLTRVELPPLPDHEDAVANDINDLGVACGGCSHRTLGTRRPVLWTGLRVEDICALAGQIPGDVAEAASIANPGQVVGWYRFTESSDTEWLERPFSYFNGALNDSRASFYTDSRYTGIEHRSGRGACGRATTRGAEPVTRAVVVSDVAGRQFIPDIGENASEASCIAFDDDAGAILVAGTTTHETGMERGFLWEGAYDEDGDLAGTATILDGPLRMLEGRALSCNRNGVVVGHYFVSPEYPSHLVQLAFVWTDESGMLDLVDLVSADSPGVRSLSDAVDINENGWIVGTLMNRENRSRGYLLIPEYAADVELGKSGDAEVEEGGELHYYFVVENRSTVEAAVKIGDPVPGGAVFDPAIGQDASWTLDDGTLETTVTVAAGQTAVVPLVLRATGEPGETITNNGYRSTVDGETSIVDDPVHTLIIEAEPLVEVEMWKSGPPMVIEVEPLVYTFLVTNPTDEDHEIVISDPLPACATFDPSVEQEYPWELRDGILTLTVTISAGQTIEIPLRLEVTCPAGSIVENIGYAYDCDGTGPVFPDGVVRTIIVSPPIELDMTKDGPDMAPHGGVLEYVFTVENRSIVPVAVTISDPVPNGTAFDPAIAQSVPWTEDDGVVSVTVTVPAEASLGVPLSLRAVGEPGTTVTNIDYSYGHGHEQPVVLDDPVLTVIVSSAPPVTLIDHPACRECLSGQTVLFEPDFSGHGGEIDFVRFYVGLELRGTDDTPPYTHEWVDVPAGIHPVRAVAFLGERPVYEALPTILIVDVHGGPAVCYEVEAMQTPYDHWAYPVAINDMGTVAGVSYDPAAWPLHACKWIGTHHVLLSSRNSWPWDIAKTGLIAGWYDTGSPEPRPCIFDRDGDLIDLPCPENASGMARGVRYNGQAIVAFETSGCGSVNGNGGLVWQDGIVHRLEGPDDAFDYHVVPTVITRQGHVIGYYHVCDAPPNSSGPYPFIWLAPDHLSELQSESSRIQRLSDNRCTSISCANNTGYVYSYSDEYYKYDVDNPLEPAVHVYRSLSMELRDLNDLLMLCGARTLNWDDDDYRRLVLRSAACLMVCGKKFELNDLVESEPGFWLRDACCINNDGVIICMGLRGGRELAFRLTPIR